MAPRGTAREKLLNAAIKLVRTHGYAGTSLDDLCEEAGVSKGAFFHHFKSKDDLAQMAAQFWDERTGTLFASADYHKHTDPLDRVLGYVDFRGEIMDGDIPEFTCFVGTMVQEAYRDAPEIRRACRDSIFGHADTLIDDIQAAIDQAGLKPKDWTAESLAHYTQATLQGAYILAKATESNEAALTSVAHLRRYIELLFAPSH
ncbi:MAG: TetR family transcriptional regulator [Ponticaulis sp.]|nr:TetR family transcriptional regulator [Ponticaulis sp.]|tara:strand:+ start:118411 stop:119016 length:606 start_codon:yes stop_codon:yes gene_type:complete